jgi:hypothetical protein
MNGYRPSRDALADGIRMAQLLGSSGVLGQLRREAERLSRFPDEMDAEWRRTHGYQSVTDRDRQQAIDVEFQVVPGEPKAGNELVAKKKDL